MCCFVGLLVVVCKRKNIFGTAAEDAGAGVLVISDCGLFRFH